MADASSRKRRKTGRTALACTFCRQRKARCSGHWPTCAACENRTQECIYPGQPPAVVLLNNLEEEPEPEEEPKVQLSDAIRRQAIRYFREHYAPTLLSFLPPQQLIEDDTGERLPWPLLLCIVALVSRFVPAIDSSSSTNNHNSNDNNNVNDHYAATATKELAQIYDEPSLTVVQCCLVLSVYEIGEGSEQRAWLRLGHAARVAQLLQLHRQDAVAVRLFDWGNSARPASTTVAEVRRRTFWCCFCLERLLANGRDRIATLAPGDISTQLPQTDENFIFGRHVPGKTLDVVSDGLEGDVDIESPLAYTVRIIDILHRIMTWHGRGGRHADARCPWLSSMPFSQLEAALQAWQARLPPLLRYTPQSKYAVLAAGQGKVWALMWMVYFHARAYLHREYLSFAPKKDYDPVTGPCDGPALCGDNNSDDNSKNPFWRDSAVALVESANAITDLYQTMHDCDLSPDAYSVCGLGLFTAASVHVLYAIFQWESMHDVMPPGRSMSYLKRDMAAFNDLGQWWSLAIHWIRQVSLYYKFSRLQQQSTGDTNDMNIKAIKDGIMNYVRQLSPDDRRARETRLKPTFDFDSWLAAMERTIERDLASSERGHVDSSRDNDRDDGPSSQPTAIDTDGFFYLDGLPPGIWPGQEQETWTMDENMWHF